MPTPDPVGSLLPGGNATPRDANPVYVTPSPDFEHDGIAFMVGDLQTDCNGVCPAAFRTDDGGATWSRVWSTSFSGGTILLPPDYPANPAVFVLEGGVRLMMSPTGDGAFTTVVPGATAAAVDPTSPPGHTRLAAVSNGVLMTWTEGAAAPTPGPALPPQMKALGLAFVGPGQVVASGLQIDPTAGPALQDAAVVTCSLVGVCGAPTVFPRYVQLDLASGPVGGPLVAWVPGGDALVSTDHGATFPTVVHPPAGRLLTTAAVDALGSGYRLVFTFAPARYATATFVSYSDDLGATLVDATGDLRSTEAAIGAESLPDGNLLVALAGDAQHHFALEESTGNGHWAAASSF
jgi:hypothetical protein